MEEVVCSCLNCKARLGCFKNSWYGIGSTYYSPVHPPVDYINGFDPVGDVHQAAPGSHVENSSLQDLECRNCQTVIGMRCADAPAGHMLKKNQLILRLAHMSVISMRTGTKANISVQEKFALTVPSAKKPSASRRASTVQPSPRLQTPSFPPGRKSMNGSMPPPPPPSSDNSQRDVDTFRSWAQEAISKQKKDIARIGSAVDRIENGMRSFQDFMEEVRTELAAHSQDMPKPGDIDTMRDNLSGLRKKVDSNQIIHETRHRHLTALTDGLIREVHVLKVPEVNRDDFEVLIKDIQKVDGKTNEIVLLKEELDSLKTRSQMMERISSGAPTAQIQTPFEPAAAITTQDKDRVSAENFVDLTTAGLPQVFTIDVEYSASQVADKSASAAKSDANGISGDTIRADLATHILSNPSKSISRDSIEVTEPISNYQATNAGLLKRKRDQTEQIRELVEPPSKKPRDSVIRPTYASKKQDPAPPTIPFISNSSAFGNSNRRPSGTASRRRNEAPPTIPLNRKDPSPILGGYYDRRELDLSQEEVPLGELQTTKLRRLRNPAISELQNGSRKPRRASLGHAEVASVRSAGRPRTRPFSVATADTDTAITNNAGSHLSEIKQPKHRNSTGNLGPPTEKLDGRALRLRRKSSNKENETLSQADSLDGPEPSKTGTTPIPTKDAVVPSIEKNSFEILIPVDANPPVNSRWQYECDRCGKRYRFEKALEKHKNIKDCVERHKGDAAREAEQEAAQARTRKMIERERLVRQTLQREM